MFTIDFTEIHAWMANPVEIVPKIIINGEHLPVRIEIAHKKNNIWVLGDGQEITAHDLCKFHDPDQLMTNFTNLVIREKSKQVSMDFTLNQQPLLDWLDGKSPFWFPPLHLMGVDFSVSYYYLVDRIWQREIDENDPTEVEYDDLLKVFKDCPLALECLAKHTVCPVKNHTVITSFLITEDTKVPDLLINDLVFHYEDGVWTGGDIGNVINIPFVKKFVNAVEN